MELETTGSGEIRYIKVLNWITVISSFTVLAWLCGRSIDTRAGFISLYTLLLTAFSILALIGLGGLIFAFNRGLRADYDFSSLMDIIARDYMIMLPFMLLALMAELYLDWNAAQVFTQAGIMTSGAVLGSDIVKLSRGKIIHIIAPIAGSFIFSALWMVISAVAQAAVR